MTTNGLAILERFPRGKELSRRSGISESAISRIFSPRPGEGRWPEERTARALARALNISVPQLYEMIELRRRG